MASTYVLPGSTGSELTQQKWARRIEKALYDRMKFIPRCHEAAEQIMNQLNVRRMGRVASQAISSTGDGTGFDFSDVDPSVIAITPSWIIAAAARPDSMKRRGGDEVDPAIAATIEGALEAGLETLVLTNIASCTTTPIGNAAYGIEAAGLRSGLATLGTNSRSNVEAGDDIHLILDTGQIDDALDIPEINQAYQRGDGKSPLVTGRLTTGFGYTFHFTTLLYSDANGKHGAIWKKEAIQYGYNKRPGPEKQRFLKQDRFMADAEIGSNIVYNEFMVPVRTA